MQFEAIVISLKRSRVTRLQALLDSWKFSIKLNVLDAIDGLTLAPDPECKLDAGTRGCLLSHIQALKLARVKNLDYVLILEDDIKFVDNFEERLNQAIDSLPEDWDMLWIAGADQIKPEPYNEHLNKLISSWGGYGYIIRKRMYDTLIDALETNNIPCDDIYRLLHRKYNSFRTIQSLVKHRNTVSVRVKTDSISKSLMKNNVTIPKIIHQMWIGDKKMPKEWMETWKEMNPDYEYILWDDEKIKNFKLRNSFQLQNCKTPTGQKEYCGIKDLYQYEIINQYGGLFIDADSIALRPLPEDILLNKVVTCFESEIKRPGLTALGFVGAIPNHPMFERIIQDCARQRTCSPAWKTIGQMMWTKHCKLNATEVKVYPSWMFIPTHYTGHKNGDETKAIAKQLWGSTLYIYKNQNEEYTPLQITPKVIEPVKQVEQVTVQHDIVNVTEVEDKETILDLDF